MSYLKPQAPLQKGDDYIYPITTADQVIATDGTHRLNNELDEIREETAVIESSSTSSHAYAVGKFLTYNGILYKVTSAIAVGDTLTPGTNITATNVGDQIKSLNDSITSSVSSLNSRITNLNEYQSTQFSRVAYFSGNFYFRKIGNVCEVSFAGTSTSIAALSDYVEMFTVTNPYKPRAGCYFNMDPANNASGTITILLRADGTFNVYNYGVATQSGLQYRLHGSYLAASTN